MQKLALLIGAITLLVAGTGTAAAEVKVEVRAEKEMAIVTEEGDMEIQRVEATRAAPGDEVIYVIRYTNDSDDDAQNVAITNPIPDHMVFASLDGGHGDAAVTFSVDGGSHYDTADNLTIVDAVGNQRPADSTDFTHVRWTILQPLGPGEVGMVGYRAELQ